MSLTHIRRLPQRFSRILFCIHDGFARIFTALSPLLGCQPFLSLTRGFLSTAGAAAAASHLMC